MKKVEDKNITGEMVNNMTDQELKDFESRLDIKAKKLNFSSKNKIHPTYGKIYTLIDNKNEVEIDGVDICELREYLYTYEEK